MQINNNTSFNFKGGFRLKNITQEAKDELPTAVKKYRQIFHNFEKPNDTFILVRDEYNSKVINFIKKHKIDFEFYPTISTKSGMDTDFPEKLSELLSSIKEPPVKTLTQCKKLDVRKKREKYIEDKSPEYVNNILTKLCIDNKHPIKSHKGAMVISDQEFNRTIMIAPPSKLKTYYVKVSPNGIDGMSERYAMDEKGNILAKFVTPDEMMLFNKKFKEQLIK